MNLISTQEALEEILPLLDTEERIAIDTEADSMHCYFEKLCLIQMSVGGQDLLIDPLAGMSMDGFFSRLSQRRIILHGADYDLRLFRRVGSPRPVSVFDTMIAARLTGRTEFSLSALILEFFGVQLAKGSQKANWAKRPLPQKMLEYAMNDTHYLEELARRLEAELQELGRTAWLEQSCAKAIEQAQTSRVRDPESAWKIAGSAKLKGRSSAVLRALWQWRDAEAQRIDKPAFYILHNSQLLEAASTLAEGGEVSFPRMSSSRARRFRVAVENALQLKEDAWPKVIRNPRSRPSVEQSAEYHRIRKVRDEAATASKLDPSLIAPKATLEQLAEDREKGLERVLPWQRELLGL